MLLLGSQGCKVVPNMCLNFISTKILKNDDYFSVFGGGKGKLTKSFLIVAQGRKENTLYINNYIICNGCMNTLKEDSSIKLCHKNLIHMSEKDFKF